MAAGTIPRLGTPTLTPMGFRATQSGYQPSLIVYSRNSPKAGDTQPWKTQDCFETSYARAHNKTR